MRTRRDVTKIVVDELVTSYEGKNAEAGNAYGDRIQKAGKLVLEGKVQKIADNHYMVGSGSTTKKVYKVNGTCDCPDYERAPAKWCKHRIAARFQHQVNLHFTRLATSGNHHHEHRYGCGNHNPPPLECWQEDCPDGTLIACPICAKNDPSPLNTTPVDDTPCPEDDTMMSSIGSTIARVFSDVCQGKTDPEAEAVVAEAEYIANTEKPLDPDRFQYEEQPVYTPAPAPLPEAAVSLCLTVKLDRDNGITYTMRGHSDQEVLERLPAVLATMERVLKVEVDHEEGFVTRILHAFFPKPSRYTGK